MVHVRPVAAELTFPLRQAILRPHQRVEELRQPDDDAPDSATVAGVDDEGRIVASGTVGRRPAPVPHDGDAWQIRGMAVAPELRDRGVGSLVLDALLDHIAARGGGLAWCNARTPARGLYERAGFAAIGEVFEIDRIGPHVVMIRPVPSQAVTENSP